MTTSSQPLPMYDLDLDQQAAEPLEHARRLVGAAASAVAASAHFEPATERRAALAVAHSQLRDLGEALTTLSRKQGLGRGQRFT